MKIKIKKQTQGPYPDELVNYNSYIRKIVTTIEDIGEENISKLEVNQNNIITEIKDDIIIAPNHITIFYSKPKDYNTISILNTHSIDEIKIFAKK